MGEATYHFPVAIGDTAYTVYGERVYRVRWLGFR